MVLIVWDKPGIAFYEEEFHMRTRMPVAAI